MGEVTSNLGVLLTILAGMLLVVLGSRWVDERERGRALEDWAWINWPTIRRGWRRRVGISRWRPGPPRTCPRFDRGQGYWALRLPWSTYCLATYLRARSDR